MLGPGCALLQQSEALGAEERLTKAGFRMEKRVPAGAEAYVLQGTEKGGVVTYRYMDPRRGVVFLGTAQQRAKYEEITKDEKAKQSAELAQITPANRRTVGPIALAP
ncbi:hypothetical protein BH09VER1_BH09VER1_25060 [soil metagenome]